jgi:putative SOS response-associated peptidase YedK
VKSFTLMTGPSSGVLADYHDRAPVVLDPDDWGVWLDPAQDAGALMAAVRAERFLVGAG